MRLKFLPFLLVLGGALPALAPMAASAQCAPADVRDSLSADERALIAEDVAATPYGLGRAFEAVRGDQELYLFGTFHSTEAGDIPASVLEAMSGASAVYVEVTAMDNAATQAQMQVDPGMIMDVTGPGLKQDLTPDEWATLTTALQPLGMPADAVNLFQPWFAATLLSLPVCELMLQAAGAEPIDLVIQSEAEDMGVPVYGLETGTEVMAVFAGIERDVQIGFLRMGITTADQNADLFMTMAQLYAEGRIAEIYALSNILGARDIPLEEIEAMGDAVLDVLLTQRNLNWMPAILAAAEAGPAVIAVGGLHLGGDDGLLRLLEAEGFAITRIVLDGEVSE